jgi:hypothetical protein
VPAPLSKFEEAEVVTDLVAVGVEHRVLAVPDRSVVEAFALLDDLLHRASGGREVGDRDDCTGAAVVGGPGDLPRRIAAEQRVLAKIRRQRFERFADRGVELPDRFEPVSLWQAGRLTRPLDCHERLDRVGRERLHSDDNAAVAVRQRARMRRKQIRGVELGAAADGVEEVRGEGEVKHFLNEHAADHLGGHGVVAILDRVEGGHLGGSVARSISIAVWR